MGEQEGFVQVRARESWDSEEDSGGHCLSLGRDRTREDGGLWRVGVWMKIGEICVCYLFNRAQILETFIGLVRGQRNHPTRRTQCCVPSPPSLASSGRGALRLRLIVRLLSPLLRLNW